MASDRYAVSWTPAPVIVVDVPLAQPLGSTVRPPGAAPVAPETPRRRQEAGGPKSASAVVTTDAVRPGAVW